MKDLVAFDLETNGFSASKHSVLSLSAQRMRVIKDELVIVPKSRYTRYYYATEAYNPEAIRVNGLDEDEIMRRRTEAHNLKKTPTTKFYTQLYLDDDYFELYAKDCILAAHNINFDNKFLLFHAPTKFCTQMSNTDIVKAPSKKSGHLYKWPSLKETAEYYEISV